MPELLTQERRLTEHQEVEKDYRWWKTSGLEWDWYINKDRGESDRMRPGPRCLICWHKNTLFPELLKSMGLDCEFGIVTEVKREETHYVIETIEKIGARVFIDNKPVEGVPTAGELEFK